MINLKVVEVDFIIDLNFLKQRWLKIQSEKNIVLKANALAKLVQDIFSLINQQTEREEKCMLIMWYESEDCLSEHKKSSLGTFHEPESFMDSSSVSKEQLHAFIKQHRSLTIDFQRDEDMLQGLIFKMFASTQAQLQKLLYEVLQNKSLE